MRFQITFILLLTSLSLYANEDKAVNDLFKKYEQVMDEKKVELVDDVFSQKFLRESGGKAEFISKVKQLEVDKKDSKTKVTWKKGVKNRFIFAKLVPVEKSKEAETSDFIVVKENGKLKIDGTAGDAE